MAIVNLEDKTEESVLEGVRDEVDISTSDGCNNDSDSYVRCCS
ncbi:MAG: hypothetical protein R3Y54_10395 [Eubacteriales bacterium]